MLLRLQRHIYASLPELLAAWGPAERALRRLLKAPFEADFRALRGLPHRHGLALDLGANRGLAIEAIRMAWPGERIVAVEPLPALAAALRRLYPDVEVINKAIGDAPGSATIYVPRYRRVAFTTRASLSRSEALGWPSRRSFAFFDPARVGLHAAEVEITTVDALGLTPDFVKFDLEGHEHQAVLGALDTIRRARPVLLIELAKPETIALLAGLGYRHCRYERGVLTAGTGHRNTFFLPG